jgi:hypothetical protein
MALKDKIIQKIEEVKQAHGGNACSIIDYFVQNFDDMMKFVNSLKGVAGRSAYVELAQMIAEDGITRPSGDPITVSDVKNNLHAVRQKLGITNGKKTKNKPVPGSGPGGVSQIASSGAVARPDKPKAVASIRPVIEPSVSVPVVSGGAGAVVFSTEFGFQLVEKEGVVFKTLDQLRSEGYQAQKFTKLAQSFITTFRISSNKTAITWDQDKEDMLAFILRKFPMVTNAKDSFRNEYENDGVKFGELFKYLVECRSNMQ